MAEKRWRQLLQEWTKPCPQCGQAWLIVSTRKDSVYTCKACGYQFTIHASAGPIKPNKDRAA